MNNPNPIEWIRKRWLYFIPAVAAVILAAVFLGPALIRPNASVGAVQAESSEESWIVKGEREAIAYYREKYGDGDVTARTLNYGCHVQIDILKDGKVVKSLSYIGTGQFYELN